MKATKDWTCRRCGRTYNDPADRIPPDSICDRHGNAPWPPAPAGALAPPNDHPGEPCARCGLPVPAGAGWATVEGRMHDDCAADFFADAVMADVSAGADRRLHVSAAPW